MDEKFETLALLVKEARKNDAEAFLLMENAKANWKKANDILTDRLKVFDGYVAQLKNEATTLDD